MHAALGPTSLPRSQDTITITVVICTRNRPDQVGRAVASILANTYSAFDLLVVDQSTDARTSDVLRSYSNHPRLTYLPMAATGLSRARNLAIERATGEVIAFTDDDCYALPDWLDRIAKVFTESPSVAMLFGAVHLPPGYSPVDGFASSYYPTVRSIAGGALGPVAPGIGANMAIRRALAKSIGYFDEVLGVGSHFSGGEDVDYAFRAAQAGHHVAADPAPVVVHVGGVRRPNECPLLWYRDAYAGGALAAKELKVRHGANALTLLQAVLRQQQAAVLAIFRGKRPTGLRRAAISTRGWIAGLVAGLRWQVIPRDGSYVFRP